MYSAQNVFYCRLFILFVQNQISFTFSCQRNKCRREKHNNNNVGQCVKCTNSIFVIFILLVKIQNLFNLLLSTCKIVAEKKKTSVIFIYV